MSDFNNKPFGDSTIPPANLEFAPVQPIEIEPAFAGTTAPSNANSNNPFRGDTHTGSNSGLGHSNGLASNSTLGSNSGLGNNSALGSGLNTGVTSTSLDDTSAFKSGSTTGTTTGSTQQKAGNLAQTAIDSLPTQETVINSKVRFNQCHFSVQSC